MNIGHIAVVLGLCGLSACAAEDARPVQERTASESAPQSDVPQGDVPQGRPMPAERTPVPPQGGREMPKPPQNKAGTVTTKAAKAASETREAELDVLLREIEALPVKANGRKAPKSPVDAALGALLRDIEALDGPARPRGTPKTTPAPGALTAKTVTYNTDVPAALQTGKAKQAALIERLATRVLSDAGLTEAPRGATWDAAAVLLTVDGTSESMVAYAYSGPKSWPVSLHGFGAFVDDALGLRGAMAKADQDGAPWAQMLLQLTRASGRVRTAYVYPGEPRFSELDEAALRPR